MITDYSWNIENWVPRRLPFKRRTTITIAWLVALLTGVQTVANEFAFKCQEWDFRVMYNSQQKVLASLLNKLFDTAAKRIRVETIADLFEPVIMYYKSELPETPVIYYKSEGMPNPPIIYYKSEIAAQLDFRVFVPTSLSGIEEQIRSWINRYNLADKQYEIVYI